MLSIVKSVLMLIFARDDCVPDVSLRFVFLGSSLTCHAASFHRFSKMEMDIKQPGSQPK